MPKQPKTDFKRSKRGCVTCRNRKKKCDEQFDARGWCQRCVTGGFTCEPVPEGGCSISKPSAPRSASANTPSRENTVGTSASSASPAISRALQSHSHYQLLPLSHAPPAQGHHQSIYAVPRPQAPPAHAFQLPPVASSSSTLFPSHPHPFAQPQQQFPQPNPPPPPQAALPLPHSHAQAQSHDPPSFSSLEQSLFDPFLGAGGDTSYYSDDLLSFFESLNPAVVAGCGFDFPDSTGTTTAAEWDFDAPPTDPTAQPQSAHFNNPPQPPAPPSQVSASHASDVDDADDLTASRPVYDALNDTFFASLPAPVRDVVKRRIGDLAFTSSSPALTKAACMAVCLLYRARMVAGTSSSGGADTASAKARERLLSRSNDYFAKAVDQLQKQSGKSGTAGAVPLEAQILATFDLQLFQLEQHGAAAGNAILLLGDNFITEALGPRPSLDLDALSKPSQVMLRCFAYTDVLRCFAMGDRRTVFNLKGVPGESEHADDSTTIITDPVATSSTLCQAKGANASAVTHSPWGLPEGLMLSFAAIANLAKDIEELEPTPFEYDWRPRRNTIEAHIRAWRATTERAATGTGEDDSVKAMDSMITSEMWRHTALIYLYQSIDGFGPLHPQIRRSLAQLTQLGSRDVMLAASGPAPAYPAMSTASSQPGRDTTDSAAADEAQAHTANGGHANATANVNGYHQVFNATFNERAMQWFVAGTVAVDEHERALCRAGLARTRPVLLAQSNLAALERVWAVQDARGWTVDWRKLLRDEGRSVAFA